MPNRAEQVKIKHLGAALSHSWKKLPGVTRKKRVAVLISGSGKQHAHFACVYVYNIVNTVSFNLHTLPSCSVQHCEYCFPQSAHFSFMYEIVNTVSLSLRTLPSHATL